MTRERDWLWAAAAYLFAFLNLGYVLKEMAGGYLDPLIAACVTATAGIVCAVLGVRYFVLPRTVPNSNDFAHLIEERRRQTTAIAFTPVLLCVVLLVVITLFGKSKLLAPADLRPTDGYDFRINGGHVGYGGSGQTYRFDYCKNVKAMTPTELAEFAFGNYGVDFRLLKRPTVKAAQITAVRLTVQSVEEAPLLDVPHAAVTEEPLVWVIDIPENVAPGIVVDGQLLKFRCTDKGRLAEFDQGLPALPNDYSLPFLVRITCKKECLIRYKLEVRTDAGWRSAPIEVCNEETVAFYNQGSKKLGNLFGGATEPAWEAVPEAPLAPEAAPAPEAPAAPEAPPSRKPPRASPAPAAQADPSAAAAPQARISHTAKAAVVDPPVPLRRR